MICAVSRLFTLNTKAQGRSQKFEAPWQLMVSGPLMTVLFHNPFSFLHLPLIILFGQWPRRGRWPMIPHRGYLGLCFYVPPPSAWPSRWGTGNRWPNNAWATVFHLLSTFFCMENFLGPLSISWGPFGTPFWNPFCLGWHARCDFTKIMELTTLRFSFIFSDCWWKYLDNRWTQRVWFCST